MEGLLKTDLASLRGHRRTSTGEVSLLLRSHVACVIKPSQIKTNLAAHQGPQMREQLWEVPKMVSQDRIQRRTAEQIVDVPIFKVFSQDRFRQRSVKQNVENPVEEGVEVVKKLSLMSEFLKGICGQIGVIEVPKISYQESVVVTIVFQEQSSERMGELREVTEVPKISHQESVEAVKLVHQERFSLICGQNGVIKVPKISINPAGANF